MQPYRDVFTGGPENNAGRKALSPKPAPDTIERRRAVNSTQLVVTGH